MLMLVCDLDSQAIREILYESTRKVLTVKFHNGGVYEYENVPKETAIDFFLAPSFGVYYNRYISLGGANTARNR
jgi:hypothetical protein